MSLATTSMDGDALTRQRAGIDQRPRSFHRFPRLSPWRVEIETGMNHLDQCNAEYYKLMDNVARRHPNPGSYKFREGNVGGSWRNIREVLSYGGNQICYIDGKVRLYDQTGLNEAFSRGSIGVRRRYEAKKFVPLQSDMASNFQISTDYLYKPWQSVTEMPEKLPRLGDPNTLMRSAGHSFVNRNL